MSSHIYEYMKIFPLIVWEWGSNYRSRCSHIDVENSNTLTRSLTQLCTLTPSVQAALQRLNRAMKGLVRSVLAALQIFVFECFEQRGFEMRIVINASCWGRRAEIPSIGRQSHLSYHCPRERHVAIGVPSQKIAWKEGYTRLWLFWFDYLLSFQFFNHWLLGIIQWGGRWLSVYDSYWQNIATSLTEVGVWSLGREEVSQLLAWGS